MNSKPYTYIWSWCTLLAATLVTVVSIAMDFVAIYNDGGFDSQGFWIAAFPFALMGLVQVALLIVTAWWVLHFVGRWKTWAIVIAALTTPIVSGLYIIQLFNVLRLPINTVGNPAPFYLLAALYVAAGVIAYYDIKYRKPTMRGAA